MRTLLAAALLVALAACASQPAFPPNGNNGYGRVGAIFGAEAGTVGGIRAGAIPSPKENKH